MQRKWPDLPQWYFIRPGESVDNIGAATYKDVATPKSLKEFLDKGRELGDQNGITHYCLVLWGHNFGLGFGRDHDDPLTIKELAEALREHAKGKWLHLLATNSCTMAYIEAAFQLKESVQYLVASQVFMPPKGFPYSSIVRSIGSATTPEVLGRTFVDEYVKSFATSSNGERVALSLLDLNGTQEFKSLLRQTADTIQKVIERGGDDALRDLQDVFLVNPVGDARPVLDLQSLGHDLKIYCDDLLANSYVAPAAKSGKIAKQSPKLVKPGDNFDIALTKLGGFADVLRDRVEKGVPIKTRGKMTGATQKLVVTHREHPDLRSLGGVGVFAPFVVDGITRKQLEIGTKDERTLYRKLAIFVRAGNWVKLVDNVLRREEPDEIVTATGVVQVADRVQVNQLVSAVDAAFSTLDRVLKSSGGALVNRLGSRVKATDLLPFGPPKLRLAGDLTLQTREKHDPPAEISAEIVVKLERIEQAVALVETTVKSVMTNGSFGLGPPAKSQEFGPKAAGGFGPKAAGGFGPKAAGGFGPKAAGGFGPKAAGGFGPKAAGGFGPKAAGGFGPDDLGAEVGALSAFLSSDTQVAVFSVAALFSAIATSLANLEDAVANIEQAAGECQLQPDFGEVLSDEEYQDAMTQRFDRLFSIAAAAASQAKRMARAVMAHPVYGLGSGPEGFGQPERDELAIIAGLSQGELALL